MPFFLPRDTVEQKLWPRGLGLVLLLCRRNSTVFTVANFALLETPLENSSFLTV